jgi:hypothetical protein
MGFTSSLCIALFCGSLLLSLTSAFPQKRTSRRAKPSSASKSTPERPVTSPPTPTLQGSYSLIDSASATTTVENAIEVSAKSMSWLFQGRTRGELKKTNVPPPECIVISYTGAEVTIETDRTGKVTTPSDGTPIKWKEYDVSTKWVNGNLERIYKEGNARRVNTYSLSGDGKTLILQVRGTRESWPKLATPLTYQLAYRRDTSTPKASPCPTPPPSPSTTPRRAISVAPPPPTPTPVPVRTERIETMTLERFDRLSKREKEKILIKDGPLYSEDFDQSDYSIRAFVKGRWPVVVDYGREAESTATLTIAANGVEYSWILDDWIVDDIAHLQLPPNVIQFDDEKGSVKKVKFVRRRAMFSLPDLGSDTVVATVSFRAKRNGAESQKAWLRVYGLSMGINEQTISSLLRSMVYRAATLNSRFPAAQEVPGSDSMIGQLIFNPTAIRTAHAQSVSCQFHSRLDLNELSVNFFRDYFYKGVFGARLVYSKRLGAIRRNEWSNQFYWNGRDQNGAPSKGLHQIQLRGWTGSVLDASWITDTPPRTLRVDF